MRTVTLTTDFGLHDYYVSAVKGALLKGYSDLKIVDISHNIENYDIVQAAYILKNSFIHFPEETIHVINVDNSPLNTEFIAFKTEGHYFIGPDNGLFSLIFKNIPKKIYSLKNDDIDTFPLLNIIPKAVAHIASGKELEKIGKSIDDIEQRITLHPVVSSNHIRGSVIYVDNYENVIVNITEELFQKNRRNRKISLYFKRNDPITIISKNFHDVPIGEPLCLFNSTGFLEIAINMGKASSLLGLNKDDTVQLDFID